MIRALLVPASLLLVACVAAPQTQTDDFSGLGDEKSDSFSSKMKIDGSLGNSGVVQIDYKNPPRYAAVKFNAVAGDTFVISVTSDGSPMVWILDHSFAIKAHSTEIDDQGVDSIILHPTKDDTDYIVVREESLADAKFTVRLEDDPPPHSCAPIKCAEGTAWDPTTCECVFTDGT